MIKVSVIVPTYNHEPYIRQCLDSLVNQETSFPYEILVGEDDSRDGTREICKEYAAKYPDKIRLFLNDRQNVVYIHGFPTGRWNFINLLRHARGEYVAFCDGDDFWNVPHKLQKQVDYLETRPDFGMVHTRAHLWFEETKHHIADFHQFKHLKVYEGRVFDSLIENSFIVTATVLMRKRFIDELLAWKPFDPYRYMLLDYAIKLYTAYHSQIGFIPEVMATHRILRESASNSKNIYKKIYYYQSQYEMIQFFCHHLQCRNASLKRAQKRFAQLLLKRYAIAGKPRETGQYLRQVFKLTEGEISNVLKNGLYLIISLQPFNFLFRKFVLPILSRYNVNY